MKHREKHWYLFEGDQFLFQWTSKKYVNRILHVNFNDCSYGWHNTEQNKDHWLQEPKVFEDLLKSPREISLDPTNET